MKDISSACASTSSEGLPIKRDLFSPRAIFRNTILSLVGKFGHSPKTPTLRFFYCHYLFNDQVEQFTEIIELLSRKGEFLNTREAVETLMGVRPLQKNAFHLSFDDGLKCIIKNAVPILKQREIPSIMFVPSAIISSPRTEYKEHRKLDPSSALEVEHASWDDIASAMDLGMEVGSHTATHSRLSEISGDSDKLNEELVGSKAFIEKKLGTSCDYISWPYGGCESIDDQSIKRIREAGYKACFGAFRAAIIPCSTDLFRIPRHHFEPNWPSLHVQAFANGFLERKYR